MSGVALPPVVDTVLVTAVDALPARLRKKVDEAVTRFAALPVTAADGRFMVAVDDTTTVTLVTDGGVVRSPDAATCTCLLAPNCLHRAAVLALAPAYAAGSPAEAEGSPAPQGTAGGTAPDTAVAGGVPDVAAPAVDQGTNPPDTTAVAAADTTAVPAEVAAEPLTAQQRAAVEHLWRAAVDVLAAGVTGSGTVARTALLRAAHEGQACKVYRPATGARVVAAMLQAARAGDPDFRLGDLTGALQELIGVLQRLRSAGGGPAEGLLGAARRAYELQGSLRLHGLCTTAVLADSGYAGVVTYVADRDGGLWMIADLMPGDARRAAKAGNATVALGETALSHRALTRAGLVVSGATASATRQLGAGRSVRAVTAGGRGWHEEPLAGLWRVPLGEQVHRAFEALALPVTDRRAGDDLVFLSVRIEGTGGGDAVDATASGGTPLTLRVADDSPALAYRDNLRLLGRATGPGGADGRAPRSGAAGHRVPAVRRAGGRPRAGTCRRRRTGTRTWRSTGCTAVTCRRPACPRHRTAPPTICGARVRRRRRRFRRRPATRCSACWRRRSSGRCPAAGPCTRSRRAVVRRTPPGCGGPGSTPARSCSTG